jgi:mannose-6-phosphate isomerase
VPVPAVLALEGVPRNYAWGSPTLIPALLGVEPDGRPVAELWLGAHPDDPSGVPARGTTLDLLIDDDPAGLLGRDVVAHFGERLPFLLKLLAADAALSIQVHPTIAQAQAGFAAEDDAGVPRDAPNRNYRDDNHKPELLCALTPFEALCGFRPVVDTLRLLDALAVPGLVEVRALLALPGGLRLAFTYLLTLASPQSLVDAVVAAAQAVDPASEWAGPARAVTLAAADAPGDVGVVLSLLLNYVRLEPGEAIYLPAGNVHAYLRGLGVEIMANSDNVLRCGLTPKHVDVPELLEITDFSELAERRCATTDEGVGAHRFVTPLPDFALTVIDFDGSVALGADRPHIVLCASGSSRVEAQGVGVDLSPGRAAFVAARSAAFTITGTGRVFVATVNLD